MIFVINKDIVTEGWKQESVVNTNQVRMCQLQLSHRLSTCPNIYHLRTRIHKPGVKTKLFQIKKKKKRKRKKRQRNQRSNCQHPLAREKAREFQKNIYFCFIDYAKAFDCVDHKKLWKILKEMGISDHLTCLLRNLYAGQEAAVRTGHGTTEWFQIGKGVRQDCILSPYLLNLYAEYIMRNAGLDEAQAGIKISRRNINNLRYADDTILMAVS